MSSFGDALISVIPVLLLAVLALGLVNEAYFFGSARMFEGANQIDFDKFSGDCFVDSTRNDFNSFCKSHFGFLGFKQWLSGSEEKAFVGMIEGISQQKVCQHGIKSLTTGNNTFTFTCMEKPPS